MAELLKYYQNVYFLEQNLFKMASEDFEMITFFQGKCKSNKNVTLC